MTGPELESRVTSLETQMAEMQVLLKGRVAKGKDWRRAVEKYVGDEDLLAVFATTAKLREADRKRARQRQNPRRSRR